MQHTKLSLTAKHFIPAGVIMVLSFLLFSSIGYPALNSDNAITVLMTYSFNLPHDWYFWGQDRMGSLIPLMGHPLVLMGLSPLLAESIAHYLLLIIGYIAFASLFKSWQYKSVLALFWFFPPTHMIDITQLSFGVHYSLIGACCYIINLKTNTNMRISTFGDFLLTIAWILIALLAVWVSELALFSLLLLVLFYFYLYVSQKSIYGILSNKDLYLYPIGGFVCFIIIQSLKSTTGIAINYSHLVTMTQLKQEFIILFQSISELLSIDKREPVTGLYLILAAVVCLLFLFSRTQSSNNHSKSKWIFYFTADALLLFAVIMASAWTLENNVPRRYFTCTYISLGMAGLLFAEYRSMRNNKIIFPLVLMTLLAGAIGTVYNLKFVWPGTLQPKAELVAELDTLGNVGLIGDYWNSYIYLVADPENKIATPHQDNKVRNPEMTEAVFKQKRIFIIKDGWLDSFPDTLMQFGRCLRKKGLPLHLADCYLNEYIVESMASDVSGSIPEQHTGD
ncbi:MAG TPA: hypothetical protein VFW78_02860 [Bacteroidia bacterium]|nr:hypothetical protein [Bacteroidia bacterium]